MNRRVLLIVVAAAICLALLSWAILRPGRPAVTGLTGEPAEGELALPTPTPAPPQRVMLLFGGGDGLLHPELRDVPMPAEVDERVRQITLEVLAGPTGGGLAPVVPWPATLSAVFVDVQGNAYVDLSAPPDPLAGSHTELLLAYGLVDSILLNCPELRAVQILLGGAEVSTLTGHLDLSRPLVLNKRFIAQ